MRNGYAIGLALLLLAGCSTVDRLPTDYAGADAGKVVVGIGAAAGTSYSSYALLFRKRDASAGAENAARGRFIYFQTNTFSKQTPDYRSPVESGVVLVHSMPPGEYEIYNFDVFFNGGTVQTNFGSRNNFSIPFSVKRGETTYLGNYQANALTGKNVLGIPRPAGAVFVVSDRLKDELAIAEAKTKSRLDSAHDATPQPSQIVNPYFVSVRPTGDAK